MRRICPLAWRHFGVQHSAPNFCLMLKHLDDFHRKLAIVTCHGIKMRAIQQGEGGR
jgi:hypothetical protein